MSAMREKDSADYDLERFIEMFDTALTSDDPRVQNALRQLMMMVILTDNSHEGRGQRANGRQGPLRRMAEDLQTLNKRLHNLSDEVQQIKLAETNRIARASLEPYQGGYKSEGSAPPEQRWAKPPQVAMGNYGEVEVEAATRGLYSNRVVGHK